MPRPIPAATLRRLATTARREGGDYVVNGEKTFITSGMRADFYTVAVRTGGPGAAGVSLLLIERERPGFTRAKLDKMGWWASDTAAVYLDEVRVPVSNLIGPENKGFIGIMLNFNQERLGMSAGACGYAKVCLDEAIAYARERHTFGKPLIANQVAINHHKADLTPRQRAMLDFAMQVALEAHAVSDADIARLREHGFSQDDVWDIGAIAAFFALSNRLANLSAMRPNDEFYLMGRVPKAK